MTDPAIAATSPAAFARYASKGKWQLARHLDMLNRAFLRVCAGQTKRLIITMPPRHGKSEYISRYAPAWYLGVYPENEVIITSYGAELAQGFSRKARDLLAEHGPTVFGTRVSSSSSAANRWGIAGTDGGCISAGVGGPVTGRGGNLIIVDDVIKEAGEAMSANHLAKIWEWYKSTLYTRLQPDGAIIIVMTRWSKADLAGRLLEAMSEPEQDQWKVLNLPAIAEENDALGRDVGEALWPQTWPLDKMEQRKTVLGPHWFNALYQQHPFAEAGAMFKEHWFEMVDAVPAEGQALRWWDLAGTAPKQGRDPDWTIGLKLRKRGHLCYVEHVARMRDNPGAVEELVIKTAEDDGYGVAIRMGEDGGQAGKDQIRRYAQALGMRDFAGVRETGSKEIRANAVSAEARAGNVKILRAPWNTPFMNCVAEFPFGAHDDDVDALSGAFNELSKGGAVMVATR